MIKNILFDYGGVLIPLRPDRCIAAFEKLGCPPEVFEGEFWLEGIFQRMDRGTATEAEFYNELRRIGHIPHATDEELLQAWNAFVLPVPPERAAKLNALRQKYQLLLLSNCNLPHWRFCSEQLSSYRGENIMDWFTKTFVSYQLHLEKPERAIYETVAREAHIRPEETLFIDDRQENLDGAAQVGFHTLITRDGDWTERIDQALRE